MAALDQLGHNYFYGVVEGARELGAGVKTMENLKKGA